MSATPRVPDNIGNYKFPFASNRETGITATASGTQSTAYQLSAQSSLIATCATNNDSVALPKIIQTPGALSGQGAGLGAILFVQNSGAASAKVYGGTGALDTINGIATGTGISLAAGQGMIFVAQSLSSANVGNWLAFFAPTASGTFTSITANDITGGDSSLGIAGQAAAQGGAIALVGGTSSTSGNAGGAITATGGTPGATGIGGAVTLAGGAGGSASGAGGAVSLTGGAATTGNTAGGAAAVAGGASTGNGTGGVASLTGGAASAATGTGGAATVTGGAGNTSGLGGAVTVTGGAGGNAAVGGAASLIGGAAGGGNSAGGAVAVTGGAATGTGAGGAASVTSGAGANGAGAATGGASGAVTIASGTAGTTATGTAGAGGAIAVTGAAGGTASGAGTGGEGGSITLTAGAGGGTSGGTAGVDGAIFARSKLSLKLSVAAKTTSTTLTAAEIVGGMITANQGGAGTATYTFPTGTDLAAALPASFTTGDTIDFYATNISTNGAEDVTFAGNTDTTLVGNAFMAANAATTDVAWAHFKFRMTGAHAFSVYRVG